MAAMRAAAWGALRLDAAHIRRWAARPRALAWGLALVFAASLLGGLADGAAHASACLRARPPRAAERGAVEVLADQLSRSPLPPDAQRTLVGNLAAALELRGELAALPRPLGREAGCTLEGLQRAAAAPYRRLAVWLPYTLAVYAVARALGGRAGLAELLAASSLHALPHLLGFLQAAPGCGRAIGAALSLWAAAIYLRAVAASSRLGAARALLAVLLPGLAALTLVAILLGVAAVLYRLGS